MNEIYALSCKDLGGTCDQILSAESWNELVDKMIRHVAEQHPGSKVEIG